MFLPAQTRAQWSGWVIQQYNSASVAMGALGKELFTFGKPYWLVPFAMFLGLWMPLPFWAAHRLLARKGLGGTWVARAAAYINTPILLLYIGYLPYSVNGQWWYVRAGSLRCLMRLTGIGRVS